MDGTNPKVSFIPKGSLVREESFLERRRPQSAIGFLAGFVFIFAVGTFAGLYYYNDSLNKIVAEKRDEINKAQKEFSDEPKVAEAKVFRARADLARELLNEHTVVSPVLKFLADNTTESILYDKFSFKKGPEGGILELTGEAPSYAALAYQTDVLKNKNTELSKFSVSNITLTKVGTVSFNFTMVFNPGYLLYKNNVANRSKETTSDAQPSRRPTVEPTPAFVETVSPEPILGNVSSDISTMTVPENASSSLGGDWSVAPVETATTTTPGGQSMLRSLWEKFKFW